MTSLTRAEGPEPGDFEVSRRTLGALIFTGYAAAALCASAEPISTDASGLITGTVLMGDRDRYLPAYVARPDRPGRHPAVVVVSEVFGVHAYIQDICRRLAKLGYVAIAPAFFVRAPGGDQLPTLTDFKEIMKIVSTAKLPQVMDDVEATLAWLEQQLFVNPARMAVTGFCWGGAVVWMACARFPQFKAGTAWYGRLSGPPPGPEVETRPWPMDVAARLKAPVLGLYGGKDKGIPVSDVEAMRERLRAAGAALSDLIVYPEAGHGFHADYRDSYDPEAAQDGWRRMLDFFRANGVTP